MTTTPSPAEPRWKFIERTIAVLEHILTPGAVVQHDQKITEIASGVLRQCDVVVRYGRPPRETLAAIVEVQDRKKKVDLPTFDAWCAKREKLGAQRLICVTCEGFTGEVETEAKSMGDLVSLMTLCETDQRPPFLATTFVMVELQVLHYRDARVVFNNKIPPVTHIVQDEVFEFPDSDKKFSLLHLGDVALRKGLAKDVNRHQIDAEFFELTYRVEFTAAGIPLLFKHDGQVYSVYEVEFTDRIEDARPTLSTAPLAYEQKTIDGALAWVLLSKGSYRGKDFYTQQTFRQLPNGEIQSASCGISKIEGMQMITHGTEMIVGINPQVAT